MQRTQESDKDTAAEAGKDELYGDFEDLETGEVHKSKETEEEKRKKQQEEEREMRMKKKAALKEQFDSQ